MCIFSRAVRHVGETRIFAGHRDRGRQSLIYAMEVELEAPTAMVLPLPTPPGVGDDAVEFVSLAGYPELFDDLDAAFPSPYLSLAAPQPAGRGPAAPPAHLTVHRVGAFVASFAPRAADLDRLDPQFRLSAAARRAVTRDRDGWSFAVVQLASTAREHVHPIALTFPRRDPSALYVPTTHVHDDTVPATARFDHTIYVQPDPAIAATMPATPSRGPIDDHVELARTAGLVQPLPTFAVTLDGEEHNDDLYALLPPAVTADDLVGAGHGWEYSARVAHGFDLAPGSGRRRGDATTQAFPAATAAHLPAWHRTARTRGSAVAAALRDWCQRFARAHGARLAALSPPLASYRYNGMQLWSDRHGPQIVDGPGAVDFVPWSERVEFQRVVVGFAQMPRADEADAWRADLIRAIDAAAR